MPYFRNCSAPFLKLNLLFHKEIKDSRNTADHNVEISYSFSFKKFGKPFTPDQTVLVSVISILSFQLGESFNSPASSLMEPRSHNSFKPQSVELPIVNDSSK